MTTTTRKNITEIRVPKVAIPVVKNIETRREWFNRKFSNNIYGTRLCEKTGFMYGECKSLKQQLGTKIENIFNVNEIYNGNVDCSVVRCMKKKEVENIIELATRSYNMINYINENMTIYGDRPGMYLLSYIAKMTDSFKIGEHNSIVYHDGPKGGEWYYYDKRDALWHIDSKETAHATIRNRLVMATQSILRVVTGYVDKLLQVINMVIDFETKEHEEIEEIVRSLEKEEKKTKPSQENISNYNNRLANLRCNLKLGDDLYSHAKSLVKQLVEVKKNHLKIRKEYASTSSKNLEMTGLSVYLNDPEFAKKLWDINNGCLAIKGNMVVEYKLKSEGARNPGVIIRPRTLTDYCIWEMPVRYPIDSGREDDKFFMTKDGVRVVRNDLKWIEMVEKFMWSPDENEHKVKIDYFTDTIALSFMGKNLATQACVLTGNGRNGKSAIMRVLGKLGGRYYVNIPYTILSDKKGSTNFDIIGLKGARLAHIDEMGKAEETISSSTLKRLVQDDGTITCRGLFKDNETFAIFATLIIACNKFPQLDETDTEGSIRRIGGADCMSVFGSVNEPREGKFLADTTLQGKLGDEFLQEVLVWLVAAMQRLCELPRIVIKNTGTKLQSELKASKNNTAMGIQEFVNECLEMGSDSEGEPNISNKDLLKLFDTYCIKKGVEDSFGLYKNHTGGGNGAKTTALKKYILDNCKIDGQTIPRWTGCKKGFTSAGQYAFYMVKAKPNRELEAMRNGNELIYSLQQNRCGENLKRFINYICGVSDEHTDGILMKMIETRGGINNFLSVPIAEIKPVSTTVRLRK
ncbi:MAG TPA: DUF5906 domain-containing protein [Methanofastidiosum sp.]|nr:DUF5906 domain-containing protein [Methanofastidiosum sp.]